MVAAAGLARQGRFEEGRALFDRALADPAAAALAGLTPTFAGYYLELPAGRLDDALAHAREAIEMLERTDPTGRLGYALTYLMAILEERGEDAEALAVAQRTRSWSQRVGLSGWVGVALAIRSASLRVSVRTTSPAPRPTWRRRRRRGRRGERGSSMRRERRSPRRMATGDGALTAAERAAREAESRWPYFDQARCAALLAPTLARAGHPQRARQIVERTIASRAPGFSTARLHAVLAWLLHDEGDEAASTAALAAAWREAGDQIKHVVRREWPRVERPIWVALEQGAIDVDMSVEALAAARPGAAALAGFIGHPVPAVRRAALLGSVAAGHPDGIERSRASGSTPIVAVAAPPRRRPSCCAAALRRSPSGCSDGSSCAAGRGSSTTAPGSAGSPSA